MISSLCLLFLKAQNNHLIGVIYFHPYSYVDYFAVIWWYRCVHLELLSGVARGCSERVVHPIYAGVDRVALDIRCTHRFALFMDSGTLDPYAGVDSGTLELYAVYIVSKCSIFSF